MSSNVWSCINHNSLSFWIKEPNRPCLSKIRTWPLRRVGKLSCNCIDPIQSYHKKMGNMGWSFKTGQDLCKSKIVTVSRCWFCPLCSTSFECSIDDCPRPPETKHIRTKIVESSLKIYSQHQHSKWTSPCHFLWNSCPYSRPALHIQWPCNFPSKSRTPVILCRVQ
jgi:hypothetical protein